MDHCFEAEVSLVGAHSDPLEFLKLAEEVFDQMPPFVHFLVDGERFCAPRVLGDDDPGAAFVEVSDDGVAVERLVCNQCIKGQPFDKRRDADCVEALSGQQHETHEIAERVGQCQDFGGHTAFGAADGLVLRPLLRPVRGGGP